MPSIKSLALLALLSLTTLVLASSDDPNTVAVLADQFPLQVPNEDAVIASKDFVDDTALDLTEDDDGEVEEMAQHHKVVITNKCGKGKGVFLYAKGKVYATTSDPTRRAALRLNASLRMLAAALLSLNPTSAPVERSFNPYSENGGTILAISSPGFAIVASDTRQSEGYSIQTRYARKCHQLTPEVVMAVQGFQADGTALVKRVKQRLEQWYYHTHQSTPSLPSIARMIQTMLYGKRFFPYYAYVILGGIDKDGTGAVYSFDPVGSYERESCRAAGAAQSLVQPFLDNMVYSKNQTQDPSKPPLAKGERPDLPLDTVLALVTDAFTGATERHIEVGDGLEMFVIKKGQPIEIISKELKRD
ncbi:hypothetical protein MNV49_006577 [Pseudohyphozyma bogoriensis]|nr:hypothetical protein MNV49_006577 [Pseudohyphozyma bogoriensis]